MQVQELRTRIHLARTNLDAVALSPAKSAALRQLDRDELILGQARGGSVEEMELLARKAERLERGAWQAALAGGLALGGAVAWNLATTGAHPFIVFGGLSAGLVPGIVIGRLAQDGARSYTSRHVQAPGVGEVVRRWKEVDGKRAAAPNPKALEPGRQNELTRLLDEVHAQVAALPEGPEKASALEALTFDRNLAGQARGATLEEMRVGCAKAAACEENGRRIGLGLGALIGVGAGAAILAEGALGIPAALLVAGSGGFMASICLGVALRDAGRDYGSRFERRGVEGLVERWSPLVAERRAQSAEILDTATRLHQGGARTAVAVEDGGVRIGGVFIRGKQR